ncbi:putative cucumisin [Lupinus albus]|uniref:Putative cucumisin n=1 Tax=Lupinus albus TaxID=3870 RepID=A0A6A4N9T9_LUPAL|nr:putative cucumisin [Lupinus albus]
MGSLPKTPYSPSSHHLSMMQQVFVENDYTNFLIHSYMISFNGFATMLTNHQKEKISQMEGVVSESDVVIGVLDTSVWPESDSFKDEGFGPVPKNWKGSCAGGKNFTCNKKIIGARYYIEDTAIDLDGHGSHTTSTAAGNYVHRASFFGLAKGTARGGVPFARIAAYKVCTELGCDSSAILSAFDDAIADGVSINSISIGSSYQYFFEEDPIAIGSFHAMAGGILAVNSAGNSGPFPAFVSSVSPWMLSVATSTIDRRFIDKVVLGNEKIL